MLRVVGFAYRTFRSALACAFVALGWLLELVIYGDHSSKDVGDYFRW